MFTKWCWLRLGPSIRPSIIQLFRILIYWVYCVGDSDEIVPSVVAHLGLHCLPRFNHLEVYDNMFLKSVFKFLVMP